MSVSRIPFQIYRLISPPAQTLMSGPRLARNLSIGFSPTQYLSGGTVLDVSIVFCYSLLFVSVPWLFLTSGFQSPKPFTIRSLTIGGILP